MKIREMATHEAAEVLRMTYQLWPDNDETELGYGHVLVLDREDGRLGGFLLLNLRSYAEGCETSPCPFVEGWWVDADLRRQGWGKALMQAAEAWARARGSTELASDSELENHVSIRAHLELGFEEVERSVSFRKRL